MVSLRGAKGSFINRGCEPGPMAARKKGAVPCSRQLVSSHSSRSSFSLFVLLDDLGWSALTFSSLAHAHAPSTPACASHLSTEEDQAEIARSRLHLPLPALSPRAHSPLARLLFDVRVLLNSLVSLSSWPPARNPYSCVDARRSAARQAQDDAEWRGRVGKQAWSVTRRGHRYHATTKAGR